MHVVATAHAPGNATSATPSRHAAAHRGGRCPREATADASDTSTTTAASTASRAKNVVTVSTDIRGEG